MAGAWPDRGRSGPCGLVKPGQAWPGQDGSRCQVPHVVMTPRSLREPEETTARSETTLAPKSFSRASRGTISAGRRRDLTAGGDVVRAPSPRRPRRLTYLGLAGWGVAIAAAA